jgi:hypothetical protein
MALEMKFGGDRKQFITLGVLGVILAGVIHINYFSGPETTTMAPLRPAALPPISSHVPSRPADTRKKAQAERRAQEFRPRVGAARPEDRLDPMSIDPSLRLDLLTRLEKIQISGGARSLFDFSSVSAAPAPTTPQGARIVAPARRPQTAPKPFIGPMPEPPPIPKPVVQKPVAPPIPLRFYGFLAPPRGGPKRAFFLDGEDIVVAGEGDLIKNRYKLIRIGLNNVTMEDTQFEQQQTLPIVPDNGGGG